MKTKPFLYLALTLLVLLGCSFFSDLAPSPSNDQPAGNSQSEGVSTEGWLLSDPAGGLAALDSFHQQLTVSFKGTVDGGDYEWVNAYQRDVWTKESAYFFTLTTSETGKEAVEELDGKVDQAHYARFGSGTPCQVSWGELDPEADAQRVLDPARSLPPIEQATDAGTETVNGVPAHHYVFSEEESGAKVEGGFWLAEPGGYVLRYELTMSGGRDMFGKGIEGEQRFEYELSKVNAPGEVVYPEGCSAVLLDFPVMDSARGLHRLPEYVDYTVSAETAAISQFYQDQLAAQGWTFVNAHDKDPKNVTLIFINKDQGKAASILLSARDTGVWVSAILRPSESTSGEGPAP